MRTFLTVNRRIAVDRKIIIQLSHLPMQKIMHITDTKTKTKQKTNKQTNAYRTQPPTRDRDLQGVT